MVSELAFLREEGMEKHRGPYTYRRKKSDSRVGLKRVSYNEK